MLRAFGFGFLFGDQHAVPVSEFHLHVRNPRARRGARRILHGQLGHSHQFPQALQHALVRDERILHIHVQAPEQGGGAPLEQDASIARVAPRAAPLDGDVFPVEGEFQAGSPLRPAAGRRGPKQPGEQSRIAPFAHDEVRVVAAQQALETEGRGFFGIVEDAPRAVHFHLQGPAPAVPGVHLRGPFEPHAHHLERRQLVINGPLVVAAFDCADCRGGSARPYWFLVGEPSGLPRARHQAVRGREGRALPYLDFHLGQGEDVFFPAVQRGQHQVRVVEPEPGIVAVGKAHQGLILRGMVDGCFEHLERPPVPDVPLLGERAGHMGARLERLPETIEPRLRAVNVKAGRKRPVNQPVAFLVPALRDEPERHPFGAGVEIENPSTECQG